MLNEVSENIWTIDGDAVPFLGFPYTTRMTIVRLSDNELWIHSPLKISDALVEEVLKLGEIKYLVSPNKLHHLFLADWMEKFPDAISYASPGLAKKRSDLSFSKELDLLPESEWSKDIDQTIFKGSFAMEEVVFFHRSSKTLILADLIENFNLSSFNWWQRIVAGFIGILSPDGKAPMDWRLTYLFGKKDARKSLSIITAWAPENIVISHGECIMGDGVEFIKKSFSWV